jgi:CheY-like chemotaxis protein
MFKEQREAVDFVIVDLIMPEMDGIAVIEELHALKPSIPIILASGYPREPERLESVSHRHPALRFLQKPYQPDELINAAKDLFHLESTSGRSLDGDGS